MTLIAHREAPPRLWAQARPLRQTWLLLAAAALAVALIAGLVVGAGLLLRPQPPEGFNSLVPVFTPQETWDSSTIPGLSNPGDIDVGSDGALYVVNGSQEILVIDPSGKVVDRWGSLGSGPGQFSFRWDQQDPTSTTGGVAVARDGTVYVADLNNRRIQHFARNAEGKYAFVGQWGTFGTGPGQFLRPYEVAVDDLGRVYVADFGRSDIQRFTRDGEYIDSAGGWGSGDGQLTDAAGLTLSPAGQVLVSDWTPARIEAWGADPGLPFAWSLGAQGQDLAADEHGNLYLTAPDGFTVLGADHRQVGSWAPSENTPDDWRQVAVSPTGTAYVTSAANGRIDRAVVDWVDDHATPVPTNLATAGPSQGLASAPIAPPAPSPTETSVLAVGAPFAMPFTLDVPPGWSLFDVQRGGAQVDYAYGTEATPVWVEVHIPTNVYLDPCHTSGGPMSPPVGLSVDELTNALTHLVGYRAGPVVDVVIDGYPGKVFDLDDAVDMTTCDDPTWLPQWTFDGSRSGTSHDIGNGDLPNAHQRIAVLDVDGTTVLVWTFFPDVRADWVVAANQVMGSIHFQ